MQTLLRKPKRALRHNNEMLAVPMLLYRAALLDVRLAQRYADLHAERSVSVPLYRPIQDWDLPSNLRRLAFSLFGIFPGTGERKGAAGEGGGGGRGRQSCTPRAASSYR